MLVFQHENMTDNVLSELSRRERQVMDVLFAEQEATVAELLELLPSAVTYSAVRATLRVLEEKGHVQHEERGPRYVYRPTLAAESARRAAVRHLVRIFFNDSVEQAAMALLRSPDMKLTPAQLDRLAREIKRARKEGR